MMHDHAGRKYCILHTTAYLLLWAGAANWGLVGLGGYIGVNLNIVNIIFGNWSWLEWLIYILIGLSAVAMLSHRGCRYCRESSHMNSPR